MTIKVWFQQLSHDDVEQNEYAHGAHRHKPSWIDGKGNDGGKNRRYSHTHVGHEAHHTCQNSAEQGLRDAQHAQAHPDGQSETEVDQELRHKISGESLSGIIECDGCRPYVCRTSDADEAVAQ